jgi:hypothetical protein
MENGMKGFWKYFILLVGSTLISLVGGIIGKTVVGYILFGVGLAAALALLVFGFIKTDYFKADRRRPMILGLLMSIFLVAGVLLVTSSSRSAASFANMQGNFSQSTNGTFASGSNSNNSGFSGNFSGQGNFSEGGTSSRRSESNGSTSGGFGSFSGTTGGNYSSARNSSSSMSLLTGSTSSSRAGSRVLETVLGAVFLAAGGIILLIALIRFLTHKVDYKEHRWQALLAGILVGGILAASVTLMVTHTTVRAMATFPAGDAMPGLSAQGTQTAPEGAGATATAEATATVAVTPTATFTPAPTATATSETISSLVVCLDPDIQWGINVRSTPSDTARNIGTIPAAGCFTINGRSVKNPGWYVMAPGQDGMGSIMINVDDTKQQLWVSDKNFDVSESFSAFLAELPVIEAAQ